MWTVQPFHLPIIRKKYTSMRTPIRCSAAADSGSFTTVSAIGSRGHIAVPKGQYGRGVFAVLSTTIDNVGLSSSFTYIPQSPPYSYSLFPGIRGLFPHKKRNRGGAKVQPVHTQKLRCLLGIGRGTNEVWAACQPVRDHYVGGLVGQSCLSRRNLHCWTHLRYRQMVGNCSYNHDCHSQ